MDTYTDRIRWREDAARREAGDLPAIPGDAYALACLAEMAARMGFGDTISDQVTDEIGELFRDEGIADDEREECFREVERRAAGHDWSSLSYTVFNAIAREERRVAAAAAKVAA